MKKFRVTNTTNCFAEIKLLLINVIMYIWASDLFYKEEKYIAKATNSCCV